MNFEEAKEILTNLSAAIIAQNLELMAQMDEADFDPSTKLDNTKNNAGYLLTKFFDALKCFPHGQVPCEVTDSVISTTDDLIAKIRKKYGCNPEVKQETIRVGQAFRNSKRLWRIKNPIKPLPQEIYERKLDESLCTILNALDDLNYELNLLPTEPPAEPPRQKRRGHDDVCEILTDIRDGILQGNEFASQTAKNTKTIRQDISGIRLGQTGPDAVLHKDPLTPAERRQVNLVKARYAEKRSANPQYSLLSVSRAVRREDHAAGVRGGYKTDLALNSRASLEIKREDAGRPPF